MSASNHIAESLRRARKSEDARNEARRQFVERTVHLGFAEPMELGLLVAEGDSWFHYPDGDVLDALDDMGYDIESVAHRGDTLESMAYDREQLDALTKRLTRLSDQGKRPRAILLSGGGNDFTKGRLEVLLNYHGSSQDVVNETIRNIALGDRVRKAYARLIKDVTSVCAKLFETPRIPILVHGYDYSIPDGRRFSKLAGLIRRGPWLKPAFDAKGYRNLEQNKDTIVGLIIYFNRQLEDVLQSLGDDFEHVRYVNLHGTLKHDKSDYKDHWSNELHPTDDGFAEIAKEFASAIEGEIDSTVA